MKAAFEAVCGDDEDKALDLLERQLDSAYGIIRPDPDGKRKARNVRGRQEEMPVLDLLIATP